MEDFLARSPSKRVAVVARVVCGAQCFFFYDSHRKDNPFRAHRRENAFINGN